MSAERARAAFITRCWLSLLSYHEDFGTAMTQGNVEAAAELRRCLGELDKRIRAEKVIVSARNEHNHRKNWGPQTDIWTLSAVERSLQHQVELDRVSR